MLNVVKERKGEVLTVQFLGTIEESVNFDQLIGPPPQSLHINCKAVTRINSEGVKSWIKYFQSIQQKGIQLKFVEVSTVIIEQINLISNFVVGAPIDSFYAPYSCPSCKTEFICLLQTADLKNKKEPPEQKCRKCNVPLHFDDIADEYFGFLVHV